MKIIIIGAGQVGSTLAENLAREYHDITLIDLDEARLQFIHCLLYTSDAADE